MLKKRVEILNNRTNFYNVCAPKYSDSKYLIKKPSFRALPHESYIEV